MKPAKGRTLWAEQHKDKVCHPTVDEAIQHRAMADFGPFVYDVYECRWGDSYEFGANEPLHWHVGKARGQWA